MLDAGAAAASQDKVDDMDGDSINAAGGKGFEEALYDPLSRLVGNRRQKRSPGEEITGTGGTDRQVSHPRRTAEG